jgi:hypothetical protein
MLGGIFVEVILACGVSRSLVRGNYAPKMEGFTIFPTFTLRPFGY